MSIERTREVMTRYWDGGDPTAIAEDAVYVDMATGERSVGRDGVRSMLRRFYREAFDVTTEGIVSHVGDGWAFTETTLVGTHVGEYAGVAASGKEVRVPLCVTYRVADDAIVEGHVYFMRNVFFEQVGATSK